MTIDRARLQSMRSDICESTDGGMAPVDGGGGGSSSSRSLSVVLLGATGAGKSALARRFAQDVWLPEADQGGGGRGGAGIGVWARRINVQGGAGSVAVILHDVAASLQRCDGVDALVAAAQVLMLVHGSTPSASTRAQVRSAASRVPVVVVHVVTHCDEADDVAATSTGGGDDDDAVFYTSARTGAGVQALFEAVAARYAAHEAAALVPVPTPTDDGGDQSALLSDEERCEAAAALGRQAPSRPPRRHRKLWARLCGCFGGAPQ